MRKQNGFGLFWTTLLWVSVSAIAQDQPHTPEFQQWLAQKKNRKQPLVDENFYHKDGRETPKLLFNQAFQAPAGAKKDERALAYLRKHYARFGLPADLGNLEWVTTKYSLLGTHYHYRQLLNGVPVDRAELIVTLSAENRVTQVFNNTYPLEKKTVRAFAMDREAALAKAAEAIEADWLEQEPIVEAVYEPNKTGFQPVYRVTHALPGSLGTWVTRVDATTSLVLSRENTTIYHTLGKGKPGLPTKVEKVMSKRSGQTVSGKRANGSAQVFDPDPRTTLAREDLQDDSPSSAFNGAYVTGELDGIMEADGVFHLQGPWVTISDFDPPSTSPSTSSNGVWTALRGQDGFDDVSAYYHISRNQAYVQSLGFTGRTGIRESSIETDTDGHLGNDFSSYDPLRNRLSFGRGCVDDVEDADIILHFYFQALLHDITPTWLGGDSGGIAQGLGDYWAGSYSYAQVNGNSFHPEWVFGWDGHGEGDSCWEGRYLDRNDARYDPEILYWEDLVLDGFTSAELWSTPLFQSMTTLVGMGRSREEADQIVLQSLFGLGSEVTLPQMAQAVINAAKGLFPDGPHAEVYRESFARHGFILPVDLQISPLSILYEDAGANGFPDPGENVSFRIALMNQGGSTARDITLAMTITPDISSLSQSSASYRDLGPGEQAYGTSFQMEISPSEGCGRTVRLDMVVTWRNDDDTLQSAELKWYIGFGSERFPAIVDEVNLTIPDNDPQGITRVITLENLPSLNSPFFHVSGSLIHPNFDELLITLTRPDGRVFERWNSEEVPGGRLYFSFPSNAYEVILDGDWILQITDVVDGDEGFLESWEVTDYFGVRCDPPEVIVRTFDTHFLFTEDNENWHSTLAVINATTVQGNLLLSAYDDQGTLVQAVERTLAPAGMLQARVSDLFNEPARITYVHAEADVYIHGQSEHITPNGDRSFGVESPLAGSEILNVPHVAEDPSFVTWGRMTNLGQTSLDVDFVNGVGARESLSLKPGGSLGLDFYDFFAGPPAAGTGWGQFLNMTNDFPDLGGVEMFGSREDSTVAGLTLTDSGGKALVIPHIPQDTASFWSGIVLVNPNQETVEVTASAFSTEALLAQTTLTLAPASKRVDVYSGFFPDMDVTGTEWLLFEADTEFTGYELVGSQDSEGDLAGLQALSGVGYYHASTFLPLDSSTDWAGLAVVSPVDRDLVSVSMEYRDEQGYLLGYDNMSQYNSKLKAQLRGFSRPAWISMRTYPLSVVFLLKGDQNSDRISAFNSLTIEEDLSELLHPIEKQ